MVQNHQRVETVQVKYGQSLSASSHHHITLARLQHIGTQYQGVGCYQPCTAACAVIAQTCQVFVAGLHVLEEMLRHIHAGHRRTRNQHDAQRVFLHLTDVDMGIRQGLTHSKHTHQRGAVEV